MKCIFTTKFKSWRVPSSHFNLTVPLLRGFFVRLAQPYRHRLLTSNLVGLIPSCSANGFDMHGSLELTEKAADYKAVLDYWVSPDKNPKEEPPFPMSLFENWFVEDDEGVQYEICIPGVFIREGKQEIMWRYF